MSWDKIEEHLFDKYCVEGEDNTLAELMEEHDRQILQEYAAKTIEELQKKQNASASKFDNAIEMHAYNSGIDDSVEILKQDCVTKEFTTENDLSACEYEIGD